MLRSGVFLAILLVCLTVPFANGHGWLVHECAKGFVGDNQNSASQTAPCGSGGSYKEICSTKVGENFLVKMHRGGGHTGDGPDSARLAFSHLDNNGTIFDQNVLGSMSFLTDPPGQDSLFQRNVIVDYNHPEFQDGLDLYEGYIQFKWTAGDNGLWYRCLKMLVAADNVDVFSVSPNSQFTATPSTTAPADYFHLANRTANNFNLLNIQGLAAGTKIYSRSGLPASIFDEASSEALYTVTGTEQNVAICTDGIVADTYLTVEHSGTAPAPYTLGTSEYPAKLFWTSTGGSTAIEDSFRHGDSSKYYHTNLFSTTSRPMRIIVINKDKKAAGTDILVSLSDNCNKDERTITSEGTDACITVPKTAGIRILEIAPSPTNELDADAMYSYTVQIEDGECSGMIFGASMLLLLAALLLAF